MNRCWWVLAGSFVLVTQLARAQEVQVQRNVMMPARDGVKLATDIYLPANRSGRLPAILIRTPYNKDGLGGIARRFARQGYAVVGQDVRGRFTSQGTFYIYTNEGRDGYDAVEWTAKQSWSNGKVGTWGGSYLAATQQAAAVERPPHLTTMFVIVGTSNYIEDGAGRGGAFALLHNMVYAFSLASSSREARADPALQAKMKRARRDVGLHLLKNPLQKHHSPLTHTPAYERWYLDWRDHSSYDTYWKQNGYNFEEYHDKYPAVPICFVGGWYDIFKRGTLRSFTGLAHKNQATRLVMGPWTHSTGITFAGNVDFGPTAKRSIVGEAEKWFAVHLKGLPQKKVSPRVQFFVMGGDKVIARKNAAKRLQNTGRWRHSQSWPPPGYQPTKYYLHPNRQLVKGQAVSFSGANSSYQFDPRNPVPSIGGNIDSGKDLVRRGAQNQVPLPSNTFNKNKKSVDLSSRKDVLSFQTNPLKKPVEIAGPIRVDLWVKSTGRDTDFTAKLVDVFPPSKDYPNGYAMNLEDGILRMRFRESRSRPKRMKPGTVYQVSIDLWSTANRFAQGHRIRLDISSSSFPMYDVNPNTGEPLGKHTKMVSVVNTVLHDQQHPSSLVLKVK